MEGRATCRRARAPARGAVAAARRPRGAPPACCCASRKRRRAQSMAGAPHALPRVRVSPPAPSPRAHGNFSEVRLLPPRRPPPPPPLRRGRRVRWRLCSSAAVRAETGRLAHPRGSSSPRGVGRRNRAPLRARRLFFSSVCPPCKAPRGPEATATTTQEGGGARARRSARLSGCPSRFEATRGGAAASAWRRNSRGGGDAAPLSVAGRGLVDCRPCPWRFRRAIAPTRN